MQIPWQRFGRRRGGARIASRSAASAQTRVACWRLLLVARVTSVACCGGVCRAPDQVYLVSQHGAAAGMFLRFGFARFFRSFTRQQKHRVCCLRHTKVGSAAFRAHPESRSDSGHRRVSPVPTWLRFTSAEAAEGDVASEAAGWSWEREERDAERRPPRWSPRHFVAFPDTEAGGEAEVQVQTFSFPSFISSVLSAAIACLFLRERPGERQRGLDTASATWAPSPSHHREATAAASTAAQPIPRTFQSCRRVLRAVHE